VIATHLSKTEVDKVVLEQNKAMNSTLRAKNNAKTNAATAKMKEEIAQLKLEVEVSQNELEKLKGSDSGLTDVQNDLELENLKSK